MEKVVSQIQKRAAQKAGFGRSAADGKRHDRVKKREKKDMEALFALYQAQGLDTQEAITKVAKGLERDPETVARHLKRPREIADDQALRRVINGELPTYEEVGPQVLVRAAGVTADDILRHYREDYRQKAKQSEESTHQKVLRQLTTEEHCSKVLNLLEAYGRQLKAPEPEERFEQFEQLDRTRSELERDPRRYLYYILLDKVTNFDETLERARSGDLKLTITFPIEDSPLFDSVRGHYEKSELWKNISMYKEETGKQFAAWLTIISLLLDASQLPLDEVLELLGIVKEMIQAGLAETRVRLSAEQIVDERWVIDKLPPEMPEVNFAALAPHFKFSDEEQTLITRLSEASHQILANYEQIKRLEKKIQEQIAKEKFKGVLPAGTKCGGDCPA